MKAEELKSTAEHAKEKNIIAEKLLESVTGGTVNTENCRTITICNSKGETRVVYIDPEGNAFDDAGNYYDGYDSVYQCSDGTEWKKVK